MSSRIHALTSITSLLTVTLAIACASSSGTNDEEESGSGGARNDLGLGTGTGGADTGAPGTTGGSGNGDPGSGGTAAGTGGSGTLGSGTPAVVPYTGACSASLTTLGAGDEPIADFETDTIAVIPAGAYGTTGWNFYATGADAGGTTTQEIVADGAAGSTQSLKIVSEGYTTAGWNAQLSQGCINVEAFTGITFWAKAADVDLVEFAIQIPQRESSVNSPAQGDCDSSAVGHECYIHPSAGIALSSEWQQYAVGFLDVGQPSASAPDAWAGVIIGLHFHLPQGGETGSNHTVFIDKMQFYSGDAPAGSIGPVSE
jgi:hypothetical protein